MTDAFIVEVNDEAAGIVVRTGRDYFFYASDQRYASLEGSAFSSPLKAERAARALKRPRSREIRGFPAKRIHADRIRAGLSAGEMK